MVVDIGIAVGRTWAHAGAGDDDDVRDVAAGGRATRTSGRPGCLVVGGSSGMVGAPLLCGRAALRIGTGMVVCAVPGREAAAQVSGQELVARALPASTNGAFAEDAAAEVLKEVGRYRSLAIGPGLGREDGTQSAVRRIVAEADVAIVIDADAFERDRRRIPRRCANETRPAGPRRCSRRTVASSNDSRANRRATTASRPHASSRPLRAIVLLKGPGTVIAHPDGRAIVNRTGNAGARDRGNRRRAHRHDRWSARAGRRAVRGRCDRRVRARPGRPSRRAPRPTSWRPTSCVPYPVP